MPSSNSFRLWLTTLSMALPVIILFLIVLSLPLAAAQVLDLTEQEITGWIFALYGLPGLVGFLLSVRYRQPLLITGNVFVIIYIASLGIEYSFPELVGASIVAGIGVALISALGFTGQLAAWIPAPIVFGLLSGAILPFTEDIFTMLGEAPLVVGSTFLAYVLGRRFLGSRLPAILPAFLVGHVVAALTSQIGPIPGDISLYLPALTSPSFSLSAITSTVPVLIVLITLQANLPSVVYLRNQGYEPPERAINVVGGLVSAAGSILGPTGISLSLPATALVAGPEAGRHSLRHRTVYIIEAAAVIAALLAGIAAEIPNIVPASLLLTLAGLATIDVLVSSIQRVTRGPLVLGPVFAFVIALSDISFLGFGRSFWALVLGIGISLLLEGDKLRELRDQTAG